MLTREEIGKCIINEKFAGRTFYKKKIDSGFEFMTAEDAYIIYHDIMKPKCYCGNDLKFRSFNVGFSSFCSNYCSNNDKGVISKQKANVDWSVAGMNISKNWERKSDIEKMEIVEKRKNTKFEKYGDENYNNRDKFKSTCVQTYGVDNPQKVKEINDRTVKTQNELYGGAFNPTQFKLTNIEKYGVEYPMQNKSVANKFSKNLARKYNGGFANTKGVVYVIESTEYIKIGVSRDFKNRFKTLEKEYGQLNVLKIFNTNYAFELESILHNTFEKYSIVLENGTGRTEWFSKDILIDLLID